ncbi:MAG: beta-ketoacyl-ACP synthase II [Gammaproteobacteria bacterium]|nr:beta-ketoacyl-ACP synthase II [Gammaproteobacteria bacterium]
MTVTAVTAASSKRRVAVTGLGIVSPLGVGLAANHAAVTSGQSGIGPITRFDPAGQPCAIAGEVSGFDLATATDGVVAAKEVKKMDRFIQFGMAAGIEAVADSGLEVTEANAARIGVYIGSGIGGVETIENTAIAVRDRGPRRVSPFYIPMSIINMISGNLSILYGMRGPNLAMVTACTTGTHAIGEAARIIEYGDADAMVAGGAEAAITPTSIAGFGNARALSRRDCPPAEASCPFDRRRDGFVMGEGAGVLVLEEWQHASRRGAQIYAELRGFGMSGDAHHMTAPAPGGGGAVRCMENALRNAAMDAAEVDYINAHGTSTPLGDVVETEAVKKVFGAHAASLTVSSTKSMVGHLLGASGGVEAVYTALALHHQTAPPTINLAQPDPQCDLDYAPHSARPMKIRGALSNSFGFGGTNGTLAMARA